MPPSYTLSHALTISGAHKNAHSKYLDYTNEESRADRGRRAEPCRVRPALQSVAQTWAPSRRFRVGSFLMALPVLASSSRKI